MTQDQLGFVSTVGHRTINAALDASEGAYMTCFDSSFDQVAIYNQVLACVEVHSDTNYEELGTRTEDRSGIGLMTTIDETGLASLDRALEANPDLFFECLGAVTEN